MARRPDTTPTMHRRLALRLALVALLVAPLAGCNDDGPRPFPKRYQLAEVNDQALPTTVATLGGTPVIVVAEFLELDGRGGATRTRYQRAEGVSPQDPVQMVVTELQYRLDGTQIQVGKFDCGPTELCAAPEVGTLVGDVLTLSWAVSSPQPVLKYALEHRIG
jgi:predicted small lipoprotein YifL